MKKLVLIFVVVLAFTLGLTIFARESYGECSSCDDNTKATFGTDNDATIYYNGTNMIIDPKEEGSGYVDVHGDLYVEGYGKIGTLGDFLYLYVGGHQLMGFSAPSMDSTIIGLPAKETITLGNFRVGSDSKKYYCGAGYDASIYYDGMDMIINPREVGDGNLSVSSTNIMDVADPVEAQDAATKNYVDSKGYVDRGDPSAYDWRETGSKTVLNTDGNWHDLDLSSIVPAGAKAVALTVLIQDDSAGKWVFFRKNGNSDVYNIASIRTQVAGVYNDGDLVVACDSNRVIEYSGYNTAFTEIRIVVKGWWL